VGIGAVADSAGCDGLRPTPMPANRYGQLPATALAGLTRVVLLSALASDRTRSSEFSRLDAPMAEPGAAVGDFRARGVPG